ncbi:MAG: TonB-dependent receptor [Sediminibacterium sp.]|nr:TonB-dependent receptor [Sediminibacterium sp.]
MSRILLLTFFLLIYGLAAKAQNNTLYGKVKSGREPLPYVIVFIEELKKGAQTDSSGIFKIDQLPEGTFTIKVKAIGYESLTKQITITNHYSEELLLNLTEDKHLNLDEVVVSGTLKEISRPESAVPVEIYNSCFFKSNPTPSLFESLQNINGVRPQVNCNICNTGDIHINGLEGPYTMVLIDGMPIVSGLASVYGLTGIPQAIIERVELVKGPASTLYGSEAVGGLLNVITKSPDKAPLFAGDVSTTNWKELNTDISTRVGIGKNTHILAGINVFNYQTPIDNNGDGFTDVTLQQRFSAFNKWQFIRKEGRLFSLAGRYVYEDRWGGDMRWKKQFRGGDSLYGESIYTNRFEWYGTYQLPLREKILFQFSANRHEQNSYYGTTPYMGLQHIGFIQVLWFKTIGRHDLLFGSAFRYTWYDDNTVATTAFDATAYPKNQPSQQRLPGAFIQDEWKINSNHKLLIGLRTDHNHLHGIVLTPRLNYKFNTSDQKAILRVSTGSGYRVANIFTEDHAALTGARQVVFKETLRPETSWNININSVTSFYKNSSNSVHLDMTLFYTHFYNRILPDYETNPNQILYTNLDGHATSKGISINIDATIGKHFKVMAGSTVMDVSVTRQGVTRRQPLTEQYTGTWTIGYTLARPGLTIDYTGNIYGPMLLPLLGPLDSRPSESPVWSIQNIQITKRFKNKIELYAGIKNLLNYTPPANSIARAFDPFDKQVTFDTQGQAIPTPNNPEALTFDPNYVFAPNQGIRGFIGLRFTLP